LFRSSLIPFPEDPSTEEMLMGASHRRVASCRVASGE